MWATVLAWLYKALPWVIETAAECAMSPIYKWLAIVGWLLMFVMTALYFHAKNAKNAK